MSILNVSNYENINDSNLTRRELKGYNFEIDMQWLLSTYNFQYNANPINSKEWKRNNIKHTVDIQMNNGIKIECKDIDGKVYPSWYKRDWKSKGNCIFSYRGDLKLSKKIFEQYHPIVIHWSLIPIYLTYNIPLFRYCNRNKLVKANNNILLHNSFVLHNDSFRFNNGSSDSSQKSNNFDENSSENSETDNLEYGKFRNPNKEERRKIAILVHLLVRKYDLKLCSLCKRYPCKLCVKHKKLQEILQKTKDSNIGEEMRKVASDRIKCLKRRLYLHYIGAKTFYTKNEIDSYYEEKRMEQNIVHALEQ